MVTKTLKNTHTCTHTPVSHWSPSPPRSKLRRPGFGNGWPIRYARRFTVKTGRSSTPGIQLRLCISQHNPKRGENGLVFVWPLGRFYKKLSNTMFRLNNIIQTKYKCHTDAWMPKTWHTGQLLDLCGFGCWHWMTAWDGPQLRGSIASCTQHQPHIIPATNVCLWTLNAHLRFSKSLHL